MNKIVIYKLLHNEIIDKIIKIKHNNKVNMWIVNRLSQIIKFKICKVCNNNMRNICLLQKAFYLLIRLIGNAMMSSSHFISAILCTFTNIWDK
jgi:hypothetical protein